MDERTKLILAINKALQLLEEIIMSQYVFEKLTPVSNSKIGIYKAALDYVFDNDDIKNIAITGSFGAGKSSLIESYKKTTVETKFLHISLGTFKKDDDQKNESILEGKILNQLIHQIPADKIPQTNFKIKSTVENKRILNYAVCFIIILLATLEFLYFDTWSSFINCFDSVFLKKVLGITTNPTFMLLLGIVCVAIISRFTYQLIKIQMNKNILKKLKIQGNELEILEATSDSFFDKYLNEVLYLFKQADVDAIVFEDIDRFDSIIIFERLKEINTLINLDKEQNKTIRFFYLVRDDIFVSKDRTKFFDYIIPVVPVVDGSNSYDQLILHLKKNKIYDRFDDAFLRKISLYIDDMRILKNICNEFIIYHSMLNIINLDYNKMFALIVYKNIFPRDFSELQLKKGYVYSLFSNKKTFIDNQIEKINTKINELKNRILLMENEPLSSVKDIDELYEFRLNKIKGMYQSAETIRERKKLEEWYKNEYPLRKEALKDIERSNLKELQHDLYIYEAQLNNIRYHKLLKELIDENSTEEFFNISITNPVGKRITFNEVKENHYFNLLKFLVTDGYIDETYEDYLTYFYESNLSRTDKIFIRSVTDRNAEDYNYKLNDPKQIMNYFNTENFDQTEILNYDLLNYLLAFHPDSAFIGQIIFKLRMSKNYIFVSSFLNFNSNKSIFIEKLSCFWPDFFSEMINSDNFSDSQIKEVSVYIIYYLTKSNLHRIDANDCLSNYISKSSDYLNICDVDIDKLIEGFKLLDIKFIKINPQNANRELLNAVYTNGLYELNLDNIILFLIEIYNLDFSDEMFHKNYSLVMSNPDSPLCHKIKNDITSYINIVFNNCDGAINDDESFVCEILNNQNLSNEQKENYIKYLVTIITTIINIKDHSLWPVLIDRDLVVCSEKNIMDYFCFRLETNQRYIDQSLIKLINRCESLDFSTIQDDYLDEQKNDLFVSATKINELGNAQYEQLLTSLDFCYDNFDIPNISNDKMKVLVDNEIIIMNSGTLLFIRKHYDEDVLYYFIEHFIHDYVDIIDQRNFSEAELLKILSWNLNDSSAIKLLKLTKAKISVLDPNYSNQIVLYILNNNLLESDMPILFSKYNTYITEIKNLIYSYAINNIQKVINSTIVDEALIEALLKSDVLSLDTKINILVAQMPHSKPYTITKNLNILDLGKFASLFEKNSRPRFEVNTQNKKLLDAFVKNNYIYEYYEDPKYKGYYKSRKHPLKQRKIS